MTDMPTAPAAPAKRPFWRRTWFVAVVALVIGFGMGSAGKGSSSAAPAPSPTATVTVAAETAVKTVEKTPQSCLKALDLASEMMDAVAAEHGAIGKAASTGNVEKFATGVAAAMQELTDESNRLQPLVAVAASDCRAKA